MAKKLLKLFFTMLKIGAFTFGGGYAMIALLEREFVEKHEWIGHDEFIDLVAIAESTPGPIAINSSTYIGYKVAGVLGSLVATVAMCIPSFAIIYFISLFFEAFLEIKLIDYAFRGIQVAVIYLIFNAGIKMLRAIKKTPFNLVMILAVFILMTASSIYDLGISSIALILLSGLTGIIAYVIMLPKKEDKK